MYMECMRINPYFNESFSFYIKLIYIFIARINDFEDFNMTKQINQHPL